MGKFDDLISTVGPGNDGVTIDYPETFLTDISGAYSEDMGLSDSRIQILETDNAALMQKNLELQAEMYTLIKQIPAVDETSSDSDDSNSDDDNDDDGDVDDIFGEPEYK